MYPKLVSIGPFFLPAYGVLVALAFLVGLWITQRLAKRAHLPSEAITNLVVYCAIAGMVGAKLLMFLFDIDYYRANPGELLSLSTLQAAGVYQGGLILALLVSIVYMRHAKLPFLRTADVFSPGLALGHAVGRLGCFAAGCCWGIACDRSWAVTFTNPEANRLVGVPLGIPLHPTQLYEVVAEIAIFLFLYRLMRQPHRDGFVFGLYLILYSISRFLIEFFRVHEQALPFGLPLSLTQWISLALLLAGVYYVMRALTQTKTAVA